MPERQRAIIDIIGNPAKVGIFQMLRSEELTSGELAKRLGAERTTVYKHLKDLAAEGLVTTDTPVNARTNQRTGMTVRWRAVPGRLRAILLELADDADPE